MANGSDEQSAAGNVDRRTLIAGAAAIGATLLMAGQAKASRRKWSERRDLFPEGVASGDPQPTSVILWTRRPFADAIRGTLHVELALDRDFTPSRLDVARHGAGRSRLDVPRARRRAQTRDGLLVSFHRRCRAMAAGWAARSPHRSPAIRGPSASPSSRATPSTKARRTPIARMIWEDERAPADRKLGFVLHLGDFIYEVFEKPAELPQRYARTVYDLGPVPDARKVSKYFYVPTTLAGYRHVYRAHIADPDIQDARAHFPFVCIGDNHEFSWQGWQSFIKYGGKVEPAQPLRVAANQAWWEYIPSRVRKASGPGLDQFDPPAVGKAPIETFDDHGFGTEANNRTAVGSMTAYRAMRYGKHVDLILTDHHSYKMADPTDRAEAQALDSGEYPVLPQEWLEIVDGGKDYNGGKPPETITIGDKTIPNFRKDEPAFTVLGREQKAWLKDRLTGSTATWKIWGVTNGPLDQRTDPQNLPVGFIKQPWMGKDYGNFGNGDFSSAYAERAEIYDLVRDRKVSGFVTVSGDRHSLLGGLCRAALAARGVRSGRAELHHRLGLRARAWARRSSFRSPPP